MLEDDTKNSIEGALQYLAPPIAVSLKAVLALLGVTMGPAWAPLLFSAYGLFGFYLFYKQEKLNKFIEWIKDNESEFTDSIINDPAFGEGFILTLEEYLRSRVEQKAGMIKEVFLGFTKSVDKDEFELERMYQVIKLMDGSQMMAFASFKKKDLIYINNYGSKHELYQEIRSLESLGLINIVIDIEINDEEEIDGDREDGFYQTGRLVTSMERSDFAQLTSFGERFIRFIDSHL